jgi:hypothetical protein
MDDATFQFIVPKVSRFVAKQRFIGIYGMITMGTIYCWYVPQLPSFALLLRIYKNNTNLIVYLKHFPKKY